MPKTSIRKLQSYLRGLSYLGVGLISAPAEISIRGKRSSKLLMSDIDLTLKGTLNEEELQNPVYPVAVVKIVGIENSALEKESRLKELGKHRSGFTLNRNRRKPI